MIRAFVTAVRTLTVLPMPGRDTGQFHRSVGLFPLVGVAIGGLAAGAGWACSSLVPTMPLLSALLVAAVEIGLTGALHIDGLADVADGFGGGRGDRERTLAIMKDPHCGVFGVVAVVLDIAARVLLVAQLIMVGRLDLLLWCIVLSRAMQSVVLASFPSARISGTAGPFVPTGRDRLLALAGPLVAIGAAVALLPVRVGTGVALSMTFTALAWGVYCTRRIGGITGDCIGAANELTIIVGLFIAVLWVGR